MATSSAAITVRTRGQRRRRASWGAPGRGRVGMTSASPAVFVVMSAILEFVSDDPPTEPATEGRAVALRRRRVIAAGHSGRVEIARAGLDDPDPDVQAAALGALARLGALTVGDVTRALRTGAAPVRRRATDAALSVRGPGSRSTLYAAVVDALSDPDPLVVVGAAWFLSERRTASGVVDLVSGRRHPWGRAVPRGCRRGIGCHRRSGAGSRRSSTRSDDKPTVRRRATVALAGFDDPAGRAGPATLG